MPKAKAIVGRANSKSVRQWGKVLWSFLQILYHPFLRKNLMSTAKCMCFKLGSLLFPKDSIFHLIRKYYLLLLFLFWSTCTKGHICFWINFRLPSPRREVILWQRKRNTRLRGNRVSDLICATLWLHDPEQITKIFWISHLKVTELGEMIYSINSFMHLFPSLFHNKFEVAWKMHRAQNKYSRKPKQRKTRKE